MSERRQWIYTLNNRMYSSGDGDTYKNILCDGYWAIPFETNRWNKSDGNDVLNSSCYEIMPIDKQKAELNQCTYHPDYLAYLQKSYTPNILTNLNWEPKVKTTNAAAVAYLNEFKNSRPNGVLWKQLTVTGGYTPKNLEEMRGSIKFSVYFNFSDPALTTQQILLSLSDIGKLKFSPLSKCRSEFYQVNENGSLVMKVDERNRNLNRGDCSIEITPNTMKLLSYHTRRFISKWVVGRYTRLYRYVKPLYDAAASTEDRNRYAIALGGTGTSPTPAYTETLPASLIPAKPRFDLLDQSFNPGILMTTTTSNQTVDSKFTATSLSYTTTDTITFTVPTGLSIFGDAVESRTSNVNVSVEAANDSTKNFIAHVKQYTPSSGVLILDNIQAISASFTPTVAARYVITPATINPALAFQTKNPTTLQPLVSSLTVAPSVSITLSINTTAQSSTLTVGSNVEIVSLTNSAAKFNAVVSSYSVNTAQDTGTLVVNTITDASPELRPSETLYYYVKLSSTTATRITGLSRENKLRILDKIAQRYYEFNNGLVKIKKILDVYQVGDTLFDVRFSYIGRDQAKTNELQVKIDALKQKYLEYRNYTMTQSELLELEKRYLAELDSLNKQLDAAVTKVGSPCGVKARSILIKPVTAQVIKLSQIQIYNNAGENIAVGYVPEGRREAASTGSTGSTGTAPPADNSTKLYADLGEDAVAAKKIFDSSGKSTAADTNTKMRLVANEIKRQERRGYLTDGTKTRRVKPFIYESSDGANTNFLSIDLGDDFDISFIDLLFPSGETPIDYTITLVDSINSPPTVRTTGVIPPGAPCTNAPPDGVKRANFQSSSSDRNCACSPLEPFKLARFFADLSGSVGANITDIDFKGYSEGIEAALSFNPKYNGGFELDINASGGNMNYTPIIIYRNNPTPTGAAAPPADMCATPEFGLRIIRDYRVNLVNSQFKTRADVTGLPNDAKYNFDGYLYFPTKILSCAKLAVSNATTSKYALKWEETPVDRKTNVQATPVTRWGQFVYTKNLNNWGANDIFYDVLQSRIYATEAALLSATGLSSLTALATPPTLSIPLPDETTLDDLFGTCPTRTCSDIEVINQLVSQYNEAAAAGGAVGSRFSNKIQRVVRAVTPAPNQCDYEVYMNTGATGATGSAGPQTISMFVKTGTENRPSLDPTQADTVGCRYTLENIDMNQATAGKFIQSNTPFLVRAYNYAVETAKPFTTIFTGIYNSLSTQATAQSNPGGTGTFDIALKEYGTSMWNAFGQIKDLSGCLANESGSKCSDPANILEFLRFKQNDYVLNRNNKRITRLLGAGTYSSNECDYTYETRDITINANGGLDLSSPQSVAERVTMQKRANTCYFTPTGAPTPVFNQPSIANLIVYDIFGKKLASLPPPPIAEIIPKPMQVATGTGITLPSTINTTTQLQITVTPADAQMNLKQVGATIVVYSSPQVYFTADIVSFTTDQNNVSILVVNNLKPPTITSTSGQTITKTILALNSLAFSSSAQYPIYGSATIQPNLVEVAASTQTPTTTDLIANPMKIGETTEAVTLPTGFTTSTQVTLKVESSKYTAGDSLIFRQVGATANQFSATVLSYAAGTLVITGITLSGTGLTQDVFTKAAKSYEIYRIEMNEFLVPQRDPVEYIDCKNAYAAKESLRVLSVVNTDIQIRNVDQFTCAVKYGTTVTNVQFTKTTGTDSLTASTQTTGSSLTAGSFTTTNSATWPATTRTATLSVNTTCTSFNPGSADIRRLIGAVNDTDAVTAYKKNPQTITDRITYEYRVTPNEYLEFGDTFKTVSLYTSGTDCTVKISTIAPSSPATSKFAFFGPGGTGSLGGRGFGSLQDYVNRFRDEWNKKFSKVTYSSNKSKVGAVSAVYHEPATDSLIIVGNAADFGVYGETDIRKFGTARIFRVTFRERYNVGTEYFVFKMEELDTLPTGIILKSFTDSYTTDPDAGKPVGEKFKIQSLQDAMKDNGVVFLRFRVLAAATNTGPTAIQKTGTRLVNTGPLNAEITRLMFYTTTATTPTQVSDLSQVSFPNAVVRMDDISGNYYRFKSSEVCKPGYSPVDDPLKISVGICKVDTSLYYMKLADTSSVTYPCSIGYEKVSAAEYGVTVPTGQEVCATTGNLGKVLDTLSFANTGTPRLKMRINQNLYIDLGQKTTIHAFSFITGLGDYRPTQWILEGSMSGLNGTWVTLHSQASAYTYIADPITENSKTPIYSFASPAIFSFKGLTPPSVINYRYTNNAVRNNIYSQNLTENYKTDAIPGNQFVTETFINPQGAPLLMQPPPSRPANYMAPPVALQDSYRLPLQVEEAPRLAIGQPVPVHTKERISHLRFRTLDTVDPNSKFVHMSMFQLITPLGPLGANYLRVSNPMGSRKTPKEGPDAVLGSATQRWVDYNKGALLFRLTGHPPTPIQSFQFSAPVGIPNAEAALPSEWILEGSIDGRTWTLLAEGDGTTGGRLLQEI